MLLGAEGSVRWAGTVWGCWTPHPWPLPPPSLQERPVEVGDWRKNVEAMSGMEGRKKMFDAAKSPTGQ